MRGRGNVGVRSWLVVIVVVAWRGAGGRCCGYAASGSAGFLKTELLTLSVRVQESRGRGPLVIGEITWPIEGVLGDDEEFSNGGAFPGLVPLSTKIDPTQGVEIMDVVGEVRGTVVVDCHTLQITDIIKKCAELSFIRDLEADVVRDL